MTKFKDRVFTTLGGLFWVFATFSYLVAGIWAFYVWGNLASGKTGTNWEYVVFWLATALTLTALERLSERLKNRNRNKL